MLLDTYELIKQIADHNINVIIDVTDSEVLHNYILTGVRTGARADGSAGNHRKDLSQSERMTSRTAIRHTAHLSIIHHNVQ